MRAIDFCVSWEMVISGKKKVVFRKDIFSVQVFTRKVMADWSLMRKRRGEASLEFVEFLVYSDGSIYTTMPVCKSGTSFRWREVHLSSTFHREAFLFFWFWRGKSFVKQVLKFQIRGFLLLNIHTLLYAGFIHSLFWLTWVDYRINLEATILIAIKWIDLLSAHQTELF